MSRWLALHCALQLGSKLVGSISAEPLPKIYSTGAYVHVNLIRAPAGYKPQKEVRPRDKGGFTAFRTYPWARCVVEPSKSL